MEIPQYLIARYLVRRQEDFRRCKSLLEEKNFSELEKIGHQIKGSGPTFGFSELSEIGLNLEEEARKTDTDCIKKVIERFSTWINEKAS